MEVFECIGRVNISAADSFDNIESQIYNMKHLKPDARIGEHIIVSYNVTEPG